MGTKKDIHARTSFLFLADGALLTLDIYTAPTCIEGFYSACISQVNIPCKK
ncbi:MAG: hypothetical protein JST87_18000 [Bacteroidetes bacterium]|nr:hypothetical protein [Bacteroidota bacterium]